MATSSVLTEIRYLSAHATGLSLDLADAVFLPLAARQLELASATASVRVTNDTLLAVADAYIAMLRDSASS